MAHLGQLHHDAVGEHDGGGHELRGLIGSIAEHDTLVAGTLFVAVLAFCCAGIHTLGDIRALGGKVVRDVHVLCVEECIICSGAVADFGNGVAHNLFVINDGLGGNLAGEHHVAVLHQRFAGYAAGGVLGQTGIENGIGDEVGHFVRVSLAYGFGREYVGVFHVLVFVFIRNL